MPPLGAKEEERREETRDQKSRSDFLPSSSLPIQGCDTRAIKRKGGSQRPTDWDINGVPSIIARSSNAVVVVCCVRATKKGKGYSWEGDSKLLQCMDGGQQEEEKRQLHAGRKRGGGKKMGRRKKGHLLLLPSL